MRSRITALVLMCVAAVLALETNTGCGRNVITNPTSSEQVQIDNPDGLQFVPADYGRSFVGLAHYPRYLTFRGTESELTVHYLRVHGAEYPQSIGIAYLVLTPRGRWDDTVFVGVAQIVSPSLTVTQRGQDEIARLLSRSYPSMLDRLAAVQGFVVKYPGVARSANGVSTVDSIIVLPDTILTDETGYITEIKEYFR